MTYNCLMCTEAAASLEHVFPAALGGRRRARDIYCETHNKAFGRHVSALLEQLDVVDAALGVRPDGYEELRTAPVRGPDGRTYLFSRQGMELAPPPDVRTTQAIIDVPTSMDFSNEKQYQRWLTRQQKQGYNAKINERGASSTGYHGGLFNDRLDLSREDFQTAIVYLALSSLAHEFPEVARHSGLEHARKVVLGDRPIDDMLWLQRPEVLDQVDFQAPYEVSHTIVLSLDAVSSRVTALVCLYGALHFAVNLGDVPTDTSRRVLRFVNPLAELPDDVHVEHQFGATLKLNSPLDGHRYWEDVQSGRRPNLIQRVIDDARHKAHVEACAVLLSGLKSLPSTAPGEQLTAIAAQLASSRQLILNMLRARAQSLPQEFNEAMALDLAVILPGLVAASADGAEGLTEDGRHVLNEATKSIAGRIRDLLRDGALDAPRLADLLYGSEGLACVEASLVIHGMSKLRPH